MGHDVGGSSVKASVCSFVNVHGKGSKEREEEGDKRVEEVDEGRRKRRNTSCSGMD